MPRTAIELLNGKSLRQLLREGGPFEWQRVFRVVGGLCDALADAHAAGTFNWRLEPTTIYLDPETEAVKILDAEIAVMRGVAASDTRVSEASRRFELGALEYESPEQLMNKKLDCRSQIYGIGVIAWELLTGKLPFADAKGPSGLITAQLEQVPLAPSEVRPAVGTQADAVVMRCLAKATGERYADLAALASAVRSAIDPQRPGS